MVIHLEFCKWLEFDYANQKVIYTQSQNLSDEIKWYTNLLGLEIQKGHSIQTRSTYWKQREENMSDRGFRNFPDYSVKLKAREKLKKYLGFSRGVKNTPAGTSHIYPSFPLNFQNSLQILFGYR